MHSKAIFNSRLQTTTLTSPGSIFLATISLTDLSDQFVSRL